jgi:CRP-like cAMP-binding protein
MRGIPNAPIEDVIVLTKGQVLFEQGDQGGDLFFIQNGEIEIYIISEGQEVVLAVMGANEVIGMMTFLTSEPRMAYARAKGDAVLKKISQLQIKGQISNLPPWMKIVLKDFTIRLKGMNSKFTQAKELIDDLRKSQLSYLYLTRQICGITAATGEYLSTTVDGKKVVVIKDFKDYLEQAMMISEELLNKLFDILIDSGMLKMFVEPDRKRKVFSVKAGQKLVSFAQFIAEAKKGQNKKLIEAKFSNKEIRVLMGLVSFAKRMDLEIKKECEIKVADLATSLEKMIGVKFESSALKTAQRLKLLKLKSDNQVISFVPTKLSRTMTNLKIYRKIERLEEVDREKRKQGLKESA